MYPNGYITVDCEGLDLTETDPQEIEGIWDKAVACISANKPIVAYNCLYGDAPVSPVPAFGWYLDDDEIVIVGATLHIHVKDDDTATVLDVVS